MNPGDIIVIKRIKEWLKDKKTIPLPAAWTMMDNMKQVKVLPWKVMESTTVRIGGKEVTVLGLAAFDDGIDWTDEKSRILNGCSLMTARAFRQWWAPVEYVEPYIIPDGILSVRKSPIIQIPGRGMI